MSPIPAYPFGPDWLFRLPSTAGAERRPTPPVPHRRGLDVAAHGSSQPAASAPAVLVPRQPTPANSPMPQASAPPAQRTPAYSGPWGAENGGPSLPPADN